MSIEFGIFPHRRMRRMRKDHFSRQLMCETRVTASDLVLPIFILEAESANEKIPSMPDVYRLGRKQVFETCEVAVDLGIPAIALFPVIEANKRSLDAAESFNPQGLVPSLVSAIKKSFPELGIITDVALDPYTSHGHDGILNDSGYILNDATNQVLQRQALCHAHAGADIVAPSDMMDGRIGKIRMVFESENLWNTRILSYAAKYASSFYGPFRDAIGSARTLEGSSKASYQMDPANKNEALTEVALDISEGADMVMIKPGLPYLDIIHAVKMRFQVPTLAYQVSGEYSMLKAACLKSYLEERTSVLESLLCLKRAGCDAIFTYFALSAAKWLQN